MPLRGCDDRVSFAKRVAKLEGGLLRISDVRVMTTTVALRNFFKKF